MADRPIIFSGPMVRALLDGRKTQTRRLLNPQPETFMVDGAECAVEAVHVEGEAVPRVATGQVLTTQKLRYAKGDSLYVRENFYQFGGPIAFAADGLPEFPRKMTPCIHMPRWASRLTLIVEDVRVERLQAISVEDAIAEGTTCYICDGGRVDGTSENDCGCFHSRDQAVPSYRYLWDSLHGCGSWDANPFVVALTFRVERGNIDRIAA